MKIHAHLHALAPGAAPSELLALVDQTAHARSQPDYEAAAGVVFAALDRLDRRLGAHRYLAEEASEPQPADFALYVALLRFELIYEPLYKLNRTRIRDFANLGPYLRDLHQQAAGRGVEPDLMAIRRAAFAADRLRNPQGTTPVGLPDLWAPHDRLRFDRASARGGIEETQDEAARAKGAFVRGVSAHRRYIGRDAEHPVAPDRYHLVVANNCPWCHRVVLARAMKGLQDVISMDVLYYRRDPERGWQFRPDLDGFDADSLYGSRFVTDLYERIGSTEKSVPILWDKALETVVNNESAEIVRMIDDAWPGRGARLAPPALRDAIDDANRWIWRDINNGAYKAGFSRDQASYERAFHRFFAATDRLDRLLSGQRWVCGDVPTEADLRLYPTLFRFDPVYYLRMRLNLRMMREYPHISRWMQDFEALPGVMEASNIEHCRLGYFGRTGDNLIPVGPAPYGPLDVPL